MRRGFLQRIVGLAVLAVLSANPARPAEPGGASIWTPLSKLTADDGLAGDQLGTSVAVSGDVAVVGAPFAGPTSAHQGAAYVFVRTGDAWSEQATLTADDGTEGDHRFGWSVAVDGDTILVGAPGATNANNSSAVYVYTRSGDAWTQQAKLTASDGSWEDDFGSSVALDGDTALVGAKQATLDGTPFRGKAYAFTRDGGTWSEQETLVPSNPAAEQFGWSLALDGLTALVGASFTDVDGVFLQGAAYVFVRAGDNWTEQAELIADDGEEGDQFGAAVALEGATAVVGAPEKRIAGRFNQGAIYLFQRDGASWSPQGRLTASDGRTGDRFGISLALDGDRLLAGAHTGGFGEGAAYVLRRDGASWTERAKLTATDGAAQNDFGRSVALDVDALLVGAPRAQVGENGGQGAAYAFADVDAGQLGFTPDLLAFGPVVVGTTSPVLSVTLTNTGSVDATVTQIAGPDGPFTAAGGTCGEPPFPAAPGASCTFDFTFTPTAQGDFGALVEIASDTPFSPDAFELTGQGVPPRPGIEVEPESLSTLLFVDETATEMLTLANPGLADLEWQVVVDDPFGDAVTLTHSASTDVVPGTVACGIPGTPYTYPTQFLRTFTLPDFGIGGDFEVAEVSFGVETLVVEDPEVATVDVTVNLYALEGDFTYANMTLLASRTVALAPQQGTSQTVPIAAVAPAGGTLVMEIAAPLLDHTGRFFAGSNPDGETAPSYLAASACGSDDPVPYASIGEPDVHLVMSVTGRPRDCALPGWLSATPTSGTLAPGAEQAVSLTFDATGLDSGFFRTDLCIAANDPDPARSVVPVLLAVTEDLQEARLTAGDGAQFEGFGAAVALDGDTAMVGASRAAVNGNTQQGAVYVFTRDGDGWSELAKLVAADGGFLGQFGNAIALEGDTALIGAFGTGVDGNMFQGAVYVFRRDGDTWSELTKLTADDGVAFDNFGDAVVLAGDTALIGAPAADIDGNDNQGATYVFVRDGDTWSQGPKLIAEDGGGNDQFGGALALDGDTALIGAGNATVEGAVAHGAAYVFTRTDTSWTEATTLLASDGAEFDRFGSAVALADGTAMVGGNGATVGGNVSQGAVWVFAGSGDAWSEQAKLTAADGAGSDNFGGAVALDGNTAIVGAEFADIDGNGNQGAAYVFRRQGDAWEGLLKLVAADGTASDTLGTAAALDGATALIGALGADVNGNNGQGAAYLFDLAAAAPELAFEPGSLAFGDVEVGTTSDTRIATLANTGDTDATGLAFSAPGSGFAVDSDACGSSLAAGESCDVVVTFSPLTTGPANAELHVDSAEKAMAVLALTGNGVEPSAPVLAFEPASLGFGDVEVGSTSPPLVTMLTNSGDADATGLTIDLAGDGFGADTSGCSATLPAGESCPVSVTFSAAEPGPVAGSLQASSAEGALAAAELSGNGVGDGGFAPIALEVDPRPLASDGNRVFEPGEQVEAAPAWRNDGTAAHDLGGTAAAFTGPEGADYTIAGPTADYGLIDPGATASCRDTGVCYGLEVDDPAARPARHWDAAFEEELEDTGGTTKTWTVHIGGSFADVPSTNLFYPAIEGLLHSGVTGGCTETAYCPAGVNSRAQMAVFMLKAAEGPDYEPPACVDGAEMFGDVLFDNAFCPWIEELARRDVVAGCGNGAYCPGDPVSRAQMSVFLLKSLGGGGYTPPTCGGVFDDVTCPSLFADWIEDLAARGITGGCSETAYCPGDPVSRAQMAAFVTKTFGVTLYGP